MSLTRDEWAKMWESVKTIERLSEYLHFSRRDVERKIKKEVESIKQQIQSVVGQME